MKKNLTIIAAALLAVCMSCNSGNETKPEETSAAPAADSAAIKNLDAVRTINKAFETGDFSTVRSLIADDAVDHAGPDGDVKGGDSIVAAIEQMAKMMSNMKSTTIKEFADKDYVFQWLATSGTMAADGFGMKKGQTYNSDAIEVTKFNSENKATEHWTFMTMNEMMKMMGGMQMPPAKNN
ncbi:MAG TPA: nuclear transport factor 2 family protein [Panacibacter sp.]|nr:nuclear transport factor 2 family protein [Panacibacter sp.]